MKLCYKSMSLKIVAYSYLNKLPLPGLENGCCLFLVPVDVMDLIVVFEVLIELLGTHQQEHGLESLRTATHTNNGGLAGC